MDVVARASAFDHVAGQRERSAAESYDRKPLAKVAGDNLNRFGYVFEFLGTIGLKLRDGSCIAQRTRDLRPIAFDKLEIQAHDFERQEKVGKNDGRIDSQTLSGSDGNVSRKLGGLTDLNDGMLFADLAVLRHVTPGLAHEPDGRLRTGLIQVSFKNFGTCAGTRRL